MIHKESNQLFIGPYAVDSERRVRAIPFTEMYGRPTGNARHLTDPAGKIYYATMEEGIYEVDVKSLKVTELFRDQQLKGGRKADLPGYHGKGLYSGQGRLIYANNGDESDAAKVDPATPSGALASWDGKAETWELLRRNQFTDVTGPGGIYGSSDPENDPVWSIGWDHRSLILAVLYHQKWSYYRLPKSSHSYDGAHGWNTEWPRIREIGEGDNLLMTMHGAFWKFPKGFTPEHSAGIVPRSNYLKVIGDFARWKDHVVFGCDDTAKVEFYNKRKSKGEIAAPQSQSNLWFVDPAALDSLGPVIGRGSLWENDAVKAGQPTDPYLFSGYDLRSLQLAHDSPNSVKFTLEVDLKGDGKWSPLTTLEVPPGKSLFHEFPSSETGAWIRIVSSADLTKATASFHYRNHDKRDSTADAMFGGLAKPGSAATGGIIRSLPDDKRTLAFTAINPDGTDIGYYELNENLSLNFVEDDGAAFYQKQNAAIPDQTGILEVDKASVIFHDEDGTRWRLPKGDAAFDQGGPFGKYRVSREVATERDVLHAHGTFYELPSRVAGGFSRIRAIATHNRAVHDFCSYRGLMIISGTDLSAPENPHLIRSNDGKTALWAGAVDDLWKLGKPRGKGGPWLDTSVKAGEKSDPYLLTGFDQKSLELKAKDDVVITAEVDLTGDGNWVTHAAFPIKAGETFQHAFPDAFSAYWIRFSSDKDTQVTAQLTYR